MKLCECGCGHPAPIAARTVERIGHVKGQPCRFIRGHSRRGRYSSVRDRFLARIGHININTDECIEWPGFRVAGYGRIHSGAKTVAVHRLSYEIFIGPIPKDKMVCHRCNNPPCFNPAHLYAGTAADNKADSVAAGTARAGGVLPPIRRGEANNKAKLTAIEVRAIRSRYEDGRSAYRIAKDFNVTLQNVMSIVHRKTWRHIE